MERSSNYTSSWENLPEILYLWNIKHNGSTSMTIEFDNIDDWQQTKKNKQLAIKETFWKHPQNNLLTMHTPAKQNKKEN